MRTACKAPSSTSPSVSFSAARRYARSAVRGLEASNAIASSSKLKRSLSGATRPQVMHMAQRFSRSVCSRKLSFANAALTFSASIPP